jgi:urease accessory protein
VRRTSGVRRAGSFDPIEASDRVRLDSENRHRRRIVLTTENGTAFLLDFSHPVALNDGDGLMLDDGSLVIVVAEPESLVEIDAPSPRDLLRLVWHLGNRHTAVELGGVVRIRRDHVLEAMLAGLGAKLTFIEAPFNPEPGGHSHGHGQHEHEDVD